MIEGRFVKFSEFLEIPSIFSPSHSFEGEVGFKCRFITFSEFSRFIGGDFCEFIQIFSKKDHFWTKWGEGFQSYKTWFLDCNHKRP